MGFLQLSRPSPEIHLVQEDLDRISKDSARGLDTSLGFGILCIADPGLKLVCFLTSIPTVALTMAWQVRGEDLRLTVPFQRRTELGICWRADGIQSGGG